MPMIVELARPTCLLDTVGTRDGLGPNQRRPWHVVYLYRHVPLWQRWDMPFFIAVDGIACRFLREFERAFRKIALTFIYLLSNFNFIARLLSLNVVSFFKFDQTIRSIGHTDKISIAWYL